MEDPQKQLIYLNKLSLLSKKDVSDIDPFSILDDIFSFATVQEMKALLLEAGIAALTEKYSWKQRSPGNLLYFYERLELLLEAGMLVLLFPKYRKKATQKNSAGSASISLPCSLSQEELEDPLLVLESFFAFQPIKKWKRQLYLWMEAGFSNYSVLDEFKPGLVLLYQQHLNKLLDACWKITGR